MKKIALILFGFLFVTVVYSQRKYYHLGRINTMDKSAVVKVIVADDPSIDSNDEQKYLYIISKNYADVSSMIDYNCLIKARKALISMVSKTADLDLSAGTLDKFIAEEPYDFNFGYLTGKGKVTWYMRLEEDKSNNILLFKDWQEIARAFDMGIDKIKELKLAHK